MPDRVKEKLVELIVNASHECEAFYDLWDMRQVADDIADFLIANGVTVQEWISVKDRLPDETVPGQNFLCWWRGHRRVCYYSRTRKCFEFNGRCVSVTHWMPLPQPPKGE